MIDLHAHSTASDGTATPSALAELGRGFALMAITDHDSCAGAKEFLAASAAAGAAGPRLAGVELSVEPGDGFDKFHLLGLGVDPDCPRLREFLREVVAGRDERNARIIANFNRIGIRMTAEDLVPYSRGGVLARPHFAALLVARGVARDRASAFAEFLVPDSPRCVYEERWRPSPRSAIDVVHAAGGVAVMAHPRYWLRPFEGTGADYRRIRDGLAGLKDAGLDGLEATYFCNSAGEDLEFNRIAIELGLLRTAGSDFHGANKQDVPLGMTVEDEAARVEETLSRIAAVRAGAGPGGGLPGSLAGGVLV